MAWNTELAFFILHRQINIGRMANRKKTMCFRLAPDQERIVQVLNFPGKWCHMISGVYSLTNNTHAQFIS